MSDISDIAGKPRNDSRYRALFKEMLNMVEEIKLVDAECHGIGLEKIASGSRYTQSLGGIMSAQGALRKQMKKLSKLQRRLENIMAQLGQLAPPEDFEGKVEAK